MQHFWVQFETPNGAHWTLNVGADEYLLAAARQAGITLPAVCEQGWCISCAAQLVEGTVDQADALRLYAQDCAAGFVLLCTAKPRTDLLLRTHQSTALRQHRAACGLPCPGGT